MKKSLLADFQRVTPAQAEDQLIYLIVLMDIRGRYWIPAFAPKETLLGQLERRGFTLANERKLSGGENQWLYWNGNTRQCVEVVSRDTWVSYVGEASVTACRK